MRFQRAALMLLVGMNVLSPAAARDLGDLVADAPEAQLSWRFAFGGPGAIHTGFGLALGYRVDGLETLAPVASFEVTHATALTRLAGLPVLQRSWRTNVEEEEPIEEEELEPANSTSSDTHWGWWAAAGVAALVVAGAAGKAANSEENDGPDTPGTTGATVDDDGAYVGCLEGTCGVCPDGSAAEHCGNGFLELMPRASIVNDGTLARLDAGTGGMGDLQ